MGCLPCFLGETLHRFLMDRMFLLHSINKVIALCLFKSDSESNAGRLVRQTGTALREFIAEVCVAEKACWTRGAHAASAWASEETRMEIASRHTQLRWRRCSVSGSWLPWRKRTAFYVFVFLLSQTRLSVLLRELISSLTGVFEESVWKLCSTYCNLIRC